MKILVGLYKPTEGKVLIHGKDKIFCGGKWWNKWKGCHKELLESKGFYAKLFAIQSEKYSAEPQLGSLSVEIRELLQKNLLTFLCGVVSY